MRVELGVTHANTCSHNVCEVMASSLRMRAPAGTAGGPTAAADGGLGVREWVGAPPHRTRGRGARSHPHAERRRSMAPGHGRRPHQPKRLPAPLDQSRHGSGWDEAARQPRSKVIGGRERYEAWRLCARRAASTASERQLPPDGHTVPASTEARGVEIHRVWACHDVQHAIGARFRSDPSCAKAQPSGPSPTPFGPRHPLDEPDTAPCTACATRAARAHLGPHPDLPVADARSSASTLGARSAARPPQSGAGGTRRAVAPSATSARTTNAMA